MAPHTLWIGTYPPAGIGTPAGHGEGIYRLELADDGSLSRPRRFVQTPAPSFVVPHPGGRVLFAADESMPGRVVAFRVHDDGLQPLGAASSGGAFPCHLAVDGDRLYAANYGDGALGVLALAPDGSLASDEPAQVLRHTGAGPDRDRQAGPHAHFVVRGPGGHVLVVDLGTDEVRRYTRTAVGLEPAGSAVRLPPGTGPRHLAFPGPPGPSHGGPGRFAYLTGELDSTVHVLAWDPATDTGEVVQTLPATGPGALPVGGPVAAPSHVALHGDGHQLTVGVRGAGVLSRFAVGADGLLTHRGDQRLPGGTPRHFAVVGDWTVVAEQVPGAVTVLAPDGTLVASRAVPSASCVVPAVRAAAPEPARPR